MKKGGRGTYTGKFVPKNKDKYIGKGINNIQYRSSWELKFFEMCDNHPNIVGWASESMSIKYYHPIEGKTKSYVPDVFVIYVDSKGRKITELVEIKPLCQTNPKYAKSDYDKEQCLINQYKWKSAMAYCKKMNIRFRIVNEQHIFRNSKHSNNIVKVGRRKK